VISQIELRRLKIQNRVGFTCPETSLSSRGKLWENRHGLLITKQTSESPQKQK
jgi:hypothetical protein